MSHPEICALLDVVLHRSWYVLFPAALVVIVFALVALSSGPEE